MRVVNILEEWEVTDDDDDVMVAVDVGLLSRLTLKPPSTTTPWKEEGAKPRTVGPTRSAEARRNDFIVILLSSVVLF